MNLQRKALRPEVYYPASDGKPMAETDIHRDLMKDLIDELKAHFEGQPDVYVSGNLLVYYVEGDPKKCFAPDVFVVKGVGNHERRIYKLWEEGRAPDVVFEISSRHTLLQDTQKKWQLYARLGVREYFLYDPEYDYMPEGLAAYRLEGETYAELEVKEGRAVSEELGLEVVDTGETLRLRDPQSGRFLPRRVELEEALQQSEKALRQEVARAERLAAKLRELGVDPEQL
jgi:Uma2 family endonuclease